jgi:signal transduction histidine kinase
VALASVASEHALGVGEVVELLDETSRVLAASRELEEKSRQLEAASAELRRVNDRLQELDRRKDEMLSTMAHELRTPLAAIRAFAEILHDHPDLELEKRREFLGIIARENERLTRLIHDLLDLARLEADGALDEARPVELAELIADATASMRQLAASRGVRIEARTAHAATTVAGDRDRLVQVVLNLLSNAIRHCPEGSGTVEVALESVDEAVRIEIRDNGPGVPAGERERIFERFRQVRGPDRTPGSGAGLGLAISRRIVEQHGGGIWVEAAPEGGARFVVRLPLCAEPSAPDTGGAGFDFTSRHPGGV